jgi:hypothetical protein
MRLHFNTIIFGGITMVEVDVKGILVGCDDLKCNFTRGNEYGGYCWVIKKKDFDTGSNVVADKISNYYKLIKDFHIYFYVYKDKKPNPTYDSDEFRTKIFGFADVADVKKKVYESGYRHHVKVKNIRLFTPKIELEEFENQLEYFDWSEKQIKKFGNTLATHGLLLTKKDCKFLQSFRFKNLV